MEVGDKLADGAEAVGLYQKREESAGALRVSALFSVEIMTGNKFELL
jgi:hypothetical protein